MLRCQGTAGSLPGHTESRNPSHSRPMAGGARSRARFTAHPLSRPSASRPSVSQRDLHRTGPRNGAQVPGELPGAQGAPVLLTTAHLRPSSLGDGLLPPDKEQRADSAGSARPPCAAGSAHRRLSPSAPMRQGKKSRRCPPGGAKKNSVCPSAPAPSRNVLPRHTHAVSRRLRMRSMRELAEAGLHGSGCPRAPPAEREAAGRPRPLPFCLPRRAARTRALSVGTGPKPPALRG